jgi:hypothetical protein
MQSHHYAIMDQEYHHAGGEGKKKRFTLITFWCALFSVVQKIMTDKMCKERNKSFILKRSFALFSSEHSSFTLQQAKAP